MKWGPDDDEAPDVEEEHTDDVAKQGTAENPGVVPTPIW